MDQYECLWAYQVEDMKADAINNDMKRSPLRQQLEKTRDYIVDRQKKYKKIEEEVADMIDRKDVISEAISHAEEQLNALESRFESNPPEADEEISSFLSDVTKCRDTISHYETELRRIVKETNTHDQQLRNVRLEAARAKQSFDQLKVDYDAELKIKKAELEAQKVKVKEAQAQVEEALLNEYNVIKKHITPPVARLQYGQCSGCNTAQPSAVLSKIKAGNLVECETCGRMIIQ